MKISLLALILSVVLFACNGKLEKAYIPRTPLANESFDEIPKSKSSVLSQVKVDSNRKDGEDHVSLHFRDTTIIVQDAQKREVKLFKNVRFINSQNTALIAQPVDSSRFTAPYYLIALKDNAVEVINLDKASKGSKDSLYTQGLIELSRTNFVINNDFIVNAVNGKVYTIKRQNPDERIQGKFLMYSKDKTTLVFLTDKSLYQVNYRTGETLNLVIPQDLFSNTKHTQAAIVSNYLWINNHNGTPFLKYNGNPDRIVDISEFKK